MIFEASPIEFDLRDASRLGFLRDQLPDQLGCFAIPAMFDFAADVFVPRAGRNQRFSLRVIDQLAVNMAAAAEDRQAGPIAHGPQMIPHSVITAPTLLIDYFLFSHVFDLCQ